MSSTTNNNNTFVSFSTTYSGEFKVVLRQWNDVTRQHIDLELDSIQFGNVLFQFKALERQFFTDMKQSEIDSVLNSIMSPTTASSERSSCKSCNDPAVTTVSKKRAQRKRKLSESSTQTDIGDGAVNI